MHIQKNSIDLFIKFILIASSFFILFSGATNAQASGSKCNMTTNQWVSGGTNTPELLGGGGWVYSDSFFGVPSGPIVNSFINMCDSSCDSAGAENCLLEVVVTGTDGSGFTQGNINCFSNNGGTIIFEGSTASRVPYAGICAAEPSLTFQVNGSTTDPVLVAHDEDVVLEWTVADATDGCTASGDWSGSKANSDGTHSENLGVLPTGMHTFNLNCYNPSGTTPKTVNVEVAPPPPTATIGVYIDLSPTPFYTDQIISPTQSIEIDWSSTDATTCIATSGAGFDTTGMTMGTTAALPTPPAGTSETYSIDCDGAVASIEITVSPAAAPVADVSPVSLDFKDVTVGSTKDLTFVVTNKGTGTLVVDSNPSITGTFAGSYTCISANCLSAQSITASSSQTYTVQYAPTATSSGQTATLELTGTESKTVSLTGNGTVAGPPLPTANFTSPLTVSINASQTTVLQWTSTGADPASCKLEEVAGGTGAKWTSEPTTGSKTVSPNVDTTYNIKCSNSSGWSPASPDVVVTVNEAPSLPVVTPDGGNTNFINDAQIFNISAIDPESDDIYYEIDWDNDGVADTVTGVVTSGTPVNVNNIWTTVTTHDFHVRAVDVNVNQTAWVKESVVITAPIPSTADLKISIDSGPWQDSLPGNINTGNSVRLQWTSNQVSCTGSGFNTGGAPENLPGLNLGTLAAGSYVYDIDCSGATDPISVDVIQLPNLTVSLPVETPSATYSSSTGNYDFINVTYQINVSGSDVASAFDTTFEIDKDGAGPLPYTPASISPLSLPGLNTASPEINVVTFTDVPFGVGATVRAITDSTGAITESNDTDNEILLPVAANPPALNMNLGLDPSDLVRGGGSIDISYDTNAIFPMNCTLSGPAMTTVSFDPALAGATGSATAGPITNKSVYTLECEEPVTGAVYRESSSVETTGAVQEI